MRYVGHKTIVLKHVGSAKDESELKILQQRAREWMEEESAQLSLFPAPTQKLLVVNRGECIRVSHCSLFRL